MIEYLSNLDIAFLIKSGKCVICTHIPTATKKEIVDNPLSNILNKPNIPTGSGNTSPYKIRTIIPKGRIGVLKTILDIESLPSET